MGAEYMGALARFPLSCLHVRTNQLTKMFWGLIVEPGRKYSQTVENSFHISKATVDLSSVTDEDITLLLDYEGQQEYILCHLNKSIKQESLDLNFQAGDVISLFTQGKGSIHLSGYLLGEDEDDDMTLGEMMEEETRMKTKSVKKRRRKKSLKPRATSDRCLSTDKPCLKRRRRWRLTPLPPLKRRNRPSPKTRRKRKGNSNRKRRLPLRR